MKSFSDMVSNVTRQIQDTGSNMTSLVEVYLNRRYREILRKLNFGVVRDYEFTTTAGQNDYVLPKDFGKELGVSDNTNYRELDKVEIKDLYEKYPGEFTTQNTVRRYVIFQDTVENQPSSASQISVVSDNSADTTQKVFIRGISDSVIKTESVTLNGTSAQTSTNSYTKIISIAKDGDTLGKVTLTAGAVTVCVFAPKENQSLYTKIKLHYAPSQALTISMSYLVKIEELENDNDYPIIDVCDLMETGAVADAWRYKRQYQKSQYEEMLFKSGVTDLVFYNESQPNKVNTFSVTTYDRETV